MSWFNKALELCGDDETRAYFRAVYWSRNNRRASAKTAAREKAEAMRPTLSEEQLSRAAEAVTLMDEVKRQRRRR